MTANTYETDFFAWANEQAALLRAGKLAAADIEHIAEEIESMGRSEYRELVSRLKQLLAHLLKWQYQPNFQGRSWLLTIEEQREELGQHLKANPSLKSKVGEALTDAYKLAATLAKKETGLDIFPVSCPYSIKQIFDNDFLPEAKTTSQ